MKLIPSILYIFLLASCNGGGGSSSTAGSPESASTPSAGSCSTPIAAPAVPAAAGQFSFSLPTTVDPCTVSGYVVGYESQLKIEQTNEGNFVINNVPSGQLDIIITGSDSSPALWLNEKQNEKGIRLKKTKFLNGLKTDAGAIDLPKMGSLSGTALLSGQTDHAGIDVYIPGTSYIAKTDSDGKYSFSAVPVGEHNLYFDKDGYHRGQIEGIAVESGVATKASDMELVLSTGAEGFLIISGGEAYSNSRAVSLTIGATNDAVLMKIAEDDAFKNKSWLPVKTYTIYTFNSDGAKNLYVKFADANGLESSPFSATITIDTVSPTTLNITGSFDCRQIKTTFTIGATDLTPMSMKITSASGFDSAEWQTFSSTITLPHIFNMKFQVKDAAGNKSEIVSITIPRTFALSQARESLVATTVGNKAIFAGGYVSGNTYSNVVDIYDSSTNTWSTATLSQARRLLSATTVGTKAIFAGGGVATFPYTSNVVDIYDASNGTWSTATLSQARESPSATTVGTKAIFAGGGVATFPYTSNVVDIYDSSSNTWSTATLSQARGNLSATTVGTKAIFAGGYDNGYSNVVDIYDSSSNTWSTATLSLARALLSATTVGTKAIFAGGRDSENPSNVVDIYDSSTNIWSTDL